MNKFTLILIMSLFSSQLWSQGIPSKNISTYTPVIEYGERAFFPMYYGNTDFEDPEHIERINADNILKIEIVSTDHPRGVNLRPLVDKRLQAVLDRIEGTELHKGEYVINSLIQTEFGSKEEAERLFHGVVVTYRPKATINRMKEEWKMVERILSGEDIPATSYSADSASDRFVDVAGEEVETFTITMYEGPHYTSRDTLWHEGYSYSSLDPGLISYQMDSTIHRIMKRNDYWNKMMVAADLTGSMYPYTAQILAWLQLESNDERVRQFVFFNDGDRKPDFKKKIGSTGGIYQGNYSAYPKVKELANLTMSRGGGGDAPENNIEALLAGLDKCRGCEDIVMIADNFAPIKDKILWEKLDQPIRVVLCGTYYGFINVDYLNLARITGGSVHTMEEDLTRLAEMNEGESIEIGGVEFAIVNGKFVRSSKS